MEKQESCGSSSWKQAQEEACVRGRGSPAMAWGSAEYSCTSMTPQSSEAFSFFSLDADGATLNSPCAHNTKQEGERMSRRPGFDRAEPAGARPAATDGVAVRRVDARRVDARGGGARD